MSEEPCPHCGILDGWHRSGCVDGTYSEEEIAAIRLQLREGIKLAQDAAKSKVNENTRLRNALETICSEADRLRQSPPPDGYGQGLRDGWSEARTIAMRALQNIS